MDPDKQTTADAYKHYLLGWMHQALSRGYKMELVRDMDGNPGHLEVTLPDNVKLQILVKTIPEEPGVPSVVQ